MAAVRHLEFAKFQFCSRDLYRHVILHFCSKFRVNRPIWGRDIAKKGFQYGVRPPSWICYDVIILHQKTAFHVPNFVLNFHDVRLHIFWNTLYFMFQHFGLKLPNFIMVFTIFAFKKFHDLEMGVKGHSRSLRVVSFDRLCMVSY